MNPEKSSKRVGDVRDMFTRIAGRYDLLNRLMTLGQDRRWRRETIRSLQLLPGDTLLDVGTGTGDLAYEALRQQAQLRVIACDFTMAMIQHGQDQNESHRIDWLIADAQALPFAPEAFDAVTSGFLLRNVMDLQLSLAEQARILKSRGRVTSLDTTPPQPGPLRPLLNLYLRWIIPALGRWIARDESAYHYLPDTTRAFITAPGLAHSFRSCGFEEVGFVRRMLGSIAIHWGVKPAQENLAPLWDEAA
jgi:demethylmenaquinone methyltransferase/2-methoxy-6-polyprenyl-1,4-benzoquinol methylase